MNVPSRLRSKAVRIARDILAGRDVMSLGTTDDDGNSHVVAVGFEYENGILRWEARTYSRHGKYAEARPQVSFLIVDEAADASVSGQVRAKATGRDQDFIGFQGDVEAFYVRLSAEDHQEHTDAIRLAPDELSA